MSQDFIYPEDSHLLIGRVGKPHGLRGELKITCFSGQPENFLDYRELILVDTNGRLSIPLTVMNCRVQGKHAVIGFGGITSREQAEEAVGAGVLVAKEHLPEIAEDEYYWHQYRGKRLIDKEGKQLGTVTELFNNGAQDVLVVTAGDEEFLIPVTKEIVVGEISGDLVINPPPGLLEINRDSSD